MITRDDIKATEAEWERAREHTSRMSVVYVILGVVFVSLMAVPASFAASLVTSGVADHLLTAIFLGVIIAPIFVLLLASARKVTGRAEEAMTMLERQLKEAVTGSEYESRLANALEMAEGEPEVLDVVERAFATTVPSSPIELLLADNSHAHLERMAMSSPTGEPPNCEVDSPDHCPAARRAQVQRFIDSDALDACPKLRARAQGRCAAVCVPVSIMGRTVGVIHATGETFGSLEDNAIQNLETLAKLAGARIGLLRVMAETQLQASTDSLTGLLNRRSLENRVQVLRRKETGLTIAMADLDNFKQLNDVHGHETGDRALRLFARTLRKSLRNHDIVSRHGGEEFAVVLPACTLADACAALENVRKDLADAIQGSGLPEFTVSFGIVEAADTEEFTEMLARADAALLQAKRTGRNLTVVHDGQGDVVSFDPAPAATAKRNGERKPRTSRTASRAGTALVPVTRPSDAPGNGFPDGQG
jgi:diguanylate cyclase (GGDEF)-like protein